MTARRHFVSCTLFFLVSVAATKVDAALVVYEGFDAGATAGALVGKSGATSVGFDAGAWGNFNGAGSALYETGGLTFGSGGTTLVTIGGNAKISTVGPNTVAVARGLNVTITGTAWGSFLMSRVANSGTETDIIELLVNTSATGHDNNAEFVIAGEEYLSTFGGLRGKSNPIWPSYNTGSALTDGDKYLVLYKATNLGGTSGTTDLSTWILSSAQFDNFKPGGLTEAELNSASTGTTSSDVMQRGTLSYTPGGSYPRLTSADFLLMQLGFGTTGQYDELRISNNASGGAGGGLDEVTPIPEPSTAALLLAGLLLMSSMRRRRILVTWSN